MPQGVVISQDPPAGTEKLMEGPDHPDRSQQRPESCGDADIIGFTQANASKKLDALGISTRWSWSIMTATMAAGCVAKTDYTAGTKINTENVTVIVSIAGERDDTLVAQTGNAGGSTNRPAAGRSGDSGRWEKPLRSSLRSTTSRCVRRPFEAAKGRRQKNSPPCEGSWPEPAGGLRGFPFAV